MTTTTQHALTDAQILQFERDGYLVLPSLFTLDEAAHIRDTFMEQAANGPVPGLFEVKRTWDGDYNPADPLARYPRMVHPHAHPETAVGQVAQQFMLDERLRGPLTELMGEEPLAVQSMFYFKPAGSRGQELHQDNFYLRVQPGTCLAAWVAVDDVDAGNGGMRVVPGSNHTEIACPQRADAAVSFTRDYVPVPDGMEAVHVDMEPGDVLFFNGSTIHGSTPNTSTDRFRRSLIFHYVPRYSQELSPFYKSPTAFDGTIIDIAPATGGGPCGTEQPMAGAPH